MELAEDETSTDDVLLHSLDCLGLVDDDILVLLQATSPLLGAEKINECIRKLLDSPDLNSTITIRHGHHLYVEGV
jgi:CMP-N-acetylneuraminic acid synthetase